MKETNGARPEFREIAIERYAKKGIELSGNDLDIAALWIEADSLDYELCSWRIREIHRALKALGVRGGYPLYMRYPHLPEVLPLVALGVTISVLIIRALL